MFVWVFRNRNSANLAIANGYGSVLRIDLGLRRWGYRTGTFKLGILAECLGYFRRFDYHIPSAAGIINSGGLGTEVYRREYPDCLGLAAATRRDSFQQSPEHLTTLLTSHLIGQ